MHQELLLANILKLIKKVLQKNFVFCVYCDRCYGKSVPLAHILNYYFNSYDQNPSSVKKFNFRKNFLETLCKCINLGL